MTLRRSEWHRRRRRDRARKRAAFIANSFSFTKQLLGEKRNSQLGCSIDEVNSFHQDTVNDSLREQELEPSTAIINPSRPTKEINSLKEVEEIIKATHSACTPGPTTRLLQQFQDAGYFWVRNIKMPLHWERHNNRLYHLCYSFTLAMNMVVKSAELECRGPLIKSGIRQPSIRAYMAELTITTTSVPGSRWILQGLERLIT